MIVTDAGAMDRYALYLRDGMAMFAYNMLDLERFLRKGQTAIPAGKHTIEFDFAYDGPGLGTGGTGAPPAPARRPARWPRSEEAGRGQESREMTDRQGHIYHRDPRGRVDR